MDKCPFCNSMFKRHYCKAKVRQIFCSKKCRYQSEYKTYTCITCNKKYIKNRLSRGDKKFCSLACIQRSPCQLCGKIILGRKTFQGGEKRFCSRKCSNVFYRTIQSKKKYVIIGFFNCIKRHGKILCEKCGNDNHGCMHVHHKNGIINGNKELIVLCANCHNIEHWGNSKKRKKDIETALFLFKNRPDLIL